MQAVIDFLTAITPILLAVITAIVTITLGLLTRAARVQTEIHALVNSQLTNLKADLIIANQRIGDLTAVIAKLKT